MDMGAPISTTTTSTTTNSLDQTHDFMNVDSFSQLPFIRPAPTAAVTTNPTKSSSSASAVRLFGIDFSSSSPTATDNSDSGDSNTLETTTKDANINNSAINSSTTTTTTSSESGRKFECHYCCRNFPTSQALGGHQNAHKRERQHAKRAHLQSAMMTAVDPTTNHFYTLANHHYPHHHHHRSTNHNAYYPTPTPLSTPTGRLSSYSSYHHQQQPPTINGSPLAMWRIPTTVHSSHHHHNNNYLNSGIHRDRSSSLHHHHHHSLPLLASGSHHHHITPSFSAIDASSSPSKPGNTNITMNMNTMNNNSSHQNHVRRGTSDQVSLDLHL